MQNSVKVLVTTTNEAKLAAIKQVFESFFGAADLYPIKVNSGVSETPVNDNEAINGCKNRIDMVRGDAGEMDYLVAMEGLVEHTEHGCFVYGWAYIEQTKTGHNGIGCSAKVKLPQALANKINKDKKLSDLVVDFYPAELTADIDVQGTNGIVTQGQFNRVDEFITALKCALGYLANSSNYQGT